MTKRDEISEMLNHWLCRGTDSPIDMADRIIACMAVPSEAMVEAVRTTACCSNQACAVRVLAAVGKAMVQP